MIKIIRSGIKKYRATCPKCKCIFEFDESDVETFGPPYDRAVRLNCPDCGEKMEGWDAEDLAKAHGGE